MNCDCTPYSLSMRMSASDPQHINNTLTGNDSTPPQSQTPSSSNNIIDNDIISSNKVNQKSEIICRQFFYQQHNLKYIINNSSLLWMN